MIKMEVVDKKFYFSFLIFLKEKLKYLDLEVFRN